MQAEISQLIFFVTMTTLIIFLFAGFIIMVLYLHQRRLLIHMEYTKKVMLDNERNLLQSQVETQEQTFHDISKEIHDNISLTLTLAKLNLNTINWNDTERIADTVTSTVEVISNAISELNNLSRSMNSDIIKNLGLHRAIKMEMERLKNFTTLEIELKIEGEPVFIDCEKELVLFRIFQESFNNILKHAEAKKVDLLLIYHKEHLEVLIEDDGVGFPIKPVEHANSKEKIRSGMLNMANRAKSIGGGLTMESIINKGTSISLSVPYQ